MEVVVHTNKGRKVMVLNPSWTVAQLKQELFTKWETPLNVPSPDEQRLVCVPVHMTQHQQQHFNPPSLLPLLPPRSVLPKHLS